MKVVTGKVLQDLLCALRLDQRLKLIEYKVTSRSALSWHLSIIFIQIQSGANEFLANLRGYWEKF
jgi:hypothetical protein